MVVTARELAERERKRLDVRKSTYKAILEQFSRTISNAASLGSHRAILTTPRFVIGYPSYSHDSASNYLERQLRRLGYRVERALPHVFHVTWDRPNASVQQQPTIIDHSNDLPSLANLAKTARDIRTRGK
jgi:hypothetical protein